MTNLHDVDMSDAKELGEGFRVLPPGEYMVFIESSERKTTKAGTGEYLECLLRVGEGDYENAAIFVRFNLWNPNAQAVEIAKSQWRSFCEATLQQPFARNNDSTTLHSIPFFVLVDNVPMNKSDPESKRSNEVIFRKGTVRHISAGKAGAPSVVKPPLSSIAAASPAASAPQQHDAAANPAPEAKAAAAAVVPGKGTAPWKR